MNSWVDSCGQYGITAPKPTFFCNPIVQPDLSAACYRHVGLGALNPDGNLKAGNTLWSSSAAFYAASPAHYYARFWHTHALGGKAYGFPYDDGAATPASSPGPIRNTCWSRSAGNVPVHGVESGSPGTRGRLLGSRVI